jgi:hypothetical protein
MSHDALPETVFAGSAAEAAMVRSLLESEGFTVYLDDERIGTMAPHIASAGGASAVKVMVPGDEAVRALELLAAYRRNV